MTNTMHASASDNEPTALFHFIDIICGCIAFCLHAKSQQRSRCIYHLTRNARSHPAMRFDHAKTNVPNIYPSAGTVSRIDVPVCHFDHDALKG